MKWSEIQAKLEASPEKKWSLHEMERTGGQPDVVDYDEQTGEYIFYDCSRESPKGRRKSRLRDITYDQAVAMAERMGVAMLDEAQYRKLQKLVRVDENSWNWIMTPPDIRNATGPLYGYRHRGDVKVHPRNEGALDAYVAWRGSLRV